MEIAVVFSFSCVCFTCSLKALIVDTTFVERGKGYTCMERENNLKLVKSTQLYSEIYQEGVILKTNLYGIKHLILLAILQSPLFKIHKTLKCLYYFP